MPPPTAVLTGLTATCSDRVLDRPGSQVKLPEMTHFAGDAKVSQMSQFIGLEHIVRNSKDIAMNQQRLTNQGQRGQNASQRGHGGQRASGVAAGSNSAVGYALDGSGGYGQKHAGSSAVGAQGNRTHQGRSGSITGNHVASRNYNSSNTNGSSSAASGGSWRSSGVPKVANNAPLASGMIGSNGQSNHPDLNDSIQPEWMNDGLVYDENQSAKQMHDMEEWKRRMKEGGGGGGPISNADMNHHHHHHNQYYQQYGGGNDVSDSIDNGLSVDQGGDKGGASRGSRFLRMFSANDVPAGPGMVGIAGSTLPVPGGLVYDAAAAASFVGEPASQKQGGDQISKLYKVFGDKLSIGSNAASAGAMLQQELLPSGWTPQDSSNMLAMQNAQALNNMHAAESMRVAMMMQAAGNSGGAPSIGPVADPGMQQQQSVAGSLPATMVPSAGGSGQSQPPMSTSAAAVSAQRIKSASPAPINEALRGIVPTSVFRKSARSGSVHSSNAPKRPESTASSSRSGTPARNLPSWLVELSGGSPSPANDSASANVITNESLGSQDLVDTLERGFPALNFKARHLDNQSVSSLSVQASAGVPSETNGGSIRRGSIETTQSNERLPEETGSAGQSSNAGIESMLPPGLNGSSATAAAMPSSVAGVSSPMAMHQHQHHIQQHQPIAQLPVGSMAIATPEVLQQMQQQQQQAIPPPGMLGMMPPHMMMPDGQMIPGLVPPPMGMIPPQHPMGFHPNMMFGMMPPHGMYGGLPPVSMPMGQMGPMPNSMAAGSGLTSEQHQQMMMLMKMMPGEMPPGMIYSQMSGGPPPPPHMFSAGIPYQGPPMQIPGSSEPNISIGAPQSSSQAFPQHSQQQ
ncbi:hypothetical protein LPJ53_004202 [Coemansia erecta]|uniref:Uncharacterized protein n=1 Tax=Coemansia erecta TaxID=147472 RepID=A0A9W7Y0B2_9FUNG|nr:hypothetical protein LPJ53_004202 [Coemansia erecta]